MFNNALADGSQNRDSRGVTDVPVPTASSLSLSSTDKVRPPSIQPVSSSNTNMRLTIELVECIIDASFYHLPTLAACSLVCKEWLPRSRHHLFSSLDLSADWTPEPNAVTEFIKIIDAPIANSTLIPYVTGVVLSKRSWGMTPVQRILSILARSGIRPAFLHINCPAYEPQPMHFPVPVFAASLAHLALYLHTDIPMATLVDHICAFPYLESLYIGGSARYSTVGQSRAQEPPPRLTTLIISDPVFAEWMLSLDPVPTQITTLVLRDVRLPHQWTAINRYLVSVAATAIRSLTFHGCDFHPEQSADLLHSTELRDLIVEHPNPIPILLSIVSGRPRSPACETLEEIELCTGTVEGLRNAADPFRALDTLLADKVVFPHLRRITVRIRVRTVEHPDLPLDYSVPEVSAVRLHKNMPLCSRRGLIFTP